LLALLLGALAGAAAAQDATEERWRWTRFGTEAGLPDDEVLDVVETQSRIVWAATRGGVAWYDGFRWRRLEAAPTHATTVRIAPAGDGASVLAVLDGRLYAGDTTGLHLLDVGGPDVEVLDAAATRDGAVALTVQGDSVRLLRVSRNRPPAEFPAPVSLPERELASLWYGTVGTFWVNARHGVHQWGPTGWQLRLASRFTPQISSLSPGTGGSAVAYVAGPTEQRGLWVFDPGRPPRLEATEGSASATAVAVSRAGDMLAAYEMGVIRLRSGGQWQSVPLPSEVQDVRATRFRPNGDVWVATGRGLYLYRRTARRWTTWSLPFPNLHSTVNAIARAPDGTIWTGTAGGLAVHRPDGRVELIERILGTTTGPVTALGIDEIGDVWVGSGQAFRGAFRWDGRRWHYHGRESGLTAFVHRIARDRSDRLWFLTIGGPDGGLGQGALLLEDGRLVSWTSERSYPDTTGRIYAFAEAPDGAYWFGSANGLYRWRDGAWSEWAQGRWFAGHAVFALAAGPDGTVWAADRLTGIAAIGPGDEWRLITSEDGPLDDRAWDLAFDPNGRLWVAAAGGLSTFLDGVWTNYRTREGLPPAPLWPLLPESSRVLIGARGNGLITLDFSEDTAPPPRVFVERPIVENGEALVRWQAHAYWGQQETGQILTRYRVDDGPWSRWSTTREVTLPRLRVGRHHFEVEAQAVFGRGRDARTATADIRVPPPVPLRPAFLVPLVLLSLTLAAFVAHYRVRRRRSEAEKRALELQLRQAQKLEAVGRLAGGIAHDFNNLLTAINANATLLADALPPDAAQGREDVAEIRAASARGAALVKKLLVFAKGAPLEVGPVDLGETVRGMAGILGRLLPENIGVALPEPPHRCIVLADRGALEQILLNLATNARDAMPAGGEITISVERREAASQPPESMEGVRPGPYGCLVVRDSGIGMDDATRQRAFDPFFTTKGAAGGSGLGLAMVFTLVRQHGGLVEITSAPGRGTAVAVCLPEAPAGSAPPSPVSAPPVPGGTETILLVEDDEGIRGVTRRVLEAQRYRVLVADDGTEALGVLRDPPQPIDLVLSDVVMPNVGGHELYRRARAAGITAPFLFVSGYTLLADHDGPVPGEVPLLAKPWTPDELLRTVRGLLDGHLR
jgi:signal transduction histidine kinase/CheY-like chemotaxis protein